MPHRAVTDGSLRSRSADELGWHLRGNDLRIHAQGGCRRFEPGRVHQLEDAAKAQVSRYESEDLGL